MITALTEEQKAKFPEYVKRWIDIGLSTDNSRFEDAEEDIKKIYIDGGQTPPKHFFYLGSPAAANYLINIIKTTGEYDVNDPEKMTLEALQAHATKVCKMMECFNQEAIYGAHDASWLSFYEFFKNECEIEECKKINGYCSLAEKVGWCYPNEDWCLITKKPCVIKRDAEGRTHSLDGYAIEYEDGFKFCEVHGVKVPDYVVINPEQITVSDIEKEENIEVRRIKINQYGQERYLMDSNSKLIHEDDWGKLYSKEILDDEPLVMVKVVNSTAEPDGTFKDYFIRVRPNVTTAKEAVASSFLLNADDYEPIMET